MCCDLNLLIFLFNVRKEYKKLVFYRNLLKIGIIKFLSIIDIKACLILPRLIRLSSVEKFGKGSFSSKFSLASSSFSFFICVFIF